MILQNARVAVDGSTTRLVESIWINQGRLHFDVGHDRGETLDLEGYLVLPGLINAHDHLEFNLFPQLGYRTYRNAREWASDVYRPDEEPVRSHRAVDRSTRLIWGAIKNLLSGVTTVAHHNPYEPEFDRAFPVRVPRNYGWAHSLAFSPDIVERYLTTPAKWPFIVHASEGTDEAAREEIDRLDRLGLLTERTIVVHALGADAEGWNRMASRGTSAVWCLSSNLSLYGTTIPREALESGVRIALGTDSAISAHTTLVEEISRAHREYSIPLAMLYSMVTSNAAAMLSLHEGEGELRDGGVADFFVVPDAGQSPAEALLDLRPEAVAVGGEIRLMNDVFATRFGGQGFHSMHVAEFGRAFLKHDLPQLLEQTVKVRDAVIRLAGREVHA